MMDQIKMGKGSKGSSSSSKGSDGKKGGKKGGGGEKAPAAITQGLFLTFFIKINK